MPIKTDQSGLIQYKAAAGDGTTLALAFNVPFYIYDITNLSVYLTPNNMPANDAEDLLVYGTDYFGISSYNPISGSYGSIQLLSASFPAGANAGDIVTIFYDFGAATIIPQYSLCSTADRVIDGILPPLPANHTWIKSSNGSSIQTIAIPTVNPITTTANSLAKYSDTTGDMTSSNVISTPIKVGAITYDDVSGINDLIVNGLTANSSLNVVGPIETVTLDTSAWLAFSNGLNSNKTYFQSTEFNSNIFYLLPIAQASTPGSFLANDAGAVNGQEAALSWVSPSSINTVGTITSGTWNAGNVAVQGTTGTVSASTGEFNSLVIPDSGNYSTSIQAPTNFAASYTYLLPTTVGGSKQILAIKEVTGNTAALTWQTPLDNPYNLIKAWVRFHAVSTFNPPFVSVAIAGSPGSQGSYGLQSVVRIATGVYQVNFAIPFTSATSYTWNATGFMTSSVDVVYILMLHSSSPNGADPTASSCTFGLYNNAGALVDPITTTGLPADVCISFCGY